MAKFDKVKQEEMRAKFAKKKSSGAETQSVKKVKVKAPDVGQMLSTLAQMAIRREKRADIDSEAKKTTVPVDKALEEVLVPFLDKFDYSVVLKKDKAEAVISNAVREALEGLQIIMPDIKIPEIPEANITVESSKVVMPKEIAVKGIKGYIDSLLSELKKITKALTDKKATQRTVLVDPAGKEYRAMAMSSGGGGGRGVVSLIKPTSSKMEQLSLTDTNTWYSTTMPSTMAGLSMFLETQGAVVYYSWDFPAKETEVRLPIFAGYSRQFENARFGGRKLYVTSPTAAQTIVFEYMLEEL